MDLATKVLEKVAGYDQILQQSGSDGLPDTEICERLRTEYFIVRTALVR